MLTCTFLGGSSPLISSAGGRTGVVEAAGTLVHGGHAVLEEAKGTLAVDLGTARGVLSPTALAEVSLTSPEAPFKGVVVDSRDNTAEEVEAEVGLALAIVSL